MNKTTMQLGSMFLAALIPTLLAHEYYWSMMVGMLGVALGITEAVSYKRTGKTISQQFGEMKTKHKLSFSGGLIAFLAILLWHLWGE